MNASPLGHTLVIANPTAHSGKGAQGAEFARRFLESYANATDGFELRLTTRAEEATEIAAAATGFDTVVALGGDGIIHETVNGLMSHDTGSRPRFGIVPMGSGNDFARTLGMARNDVEGALAQLLRGEPRRIELGRVTSDISPEGAYFMETLSFGLDAAIAIDTTERRAAGTDSEGEQLFMSSAIKLVSKGSKGYPMRFSLDGGPEQSMRALIFAIQNGPTYGGGFRICPAADPGDGLLTVCYNTRVPSLPHVMALFGLARFGKQVHSSLIRQEQVRKVEIAFDEEVPPCQIDGEEFKGTRFTVEVVPDALEVLFAAG